MTVSLKHAFVSGKGDGTDPTKVQPSNWNEEHELGLATGKVLGRVTAGSGPVEEIDWSAYGRQIINVLNAAALRGLVGEVSNIANDIVTFSKLRDASGPSKLLGSNSNAALAIAGAANNGVGLIRLAVSSTATFTTGQTKKVSGVLGTIEANGSWVITVVDATHIDLQGSAFVNNYVSGGAIGAGYEEITLGNNMQMSNSTLNVLLYSNLMHVQNQQAQNVGGDVINGTYTQRVLNTVVSNDITGASLSGNQITLPAGTYDITARLPVYQQEPGSGNQAYAKSQLYDITSGASLAYSSAVFMLANSSVMRMNDNCFITGRFVFAAQKTIEFRTISLRATIGGLATNMGGIEIYSDVQIRKVL